MAKKFKLKRDWKKLLVVGLSAILGVGAIFGITRLAEKAEETHKKITPTFTVGGLNESGKYEETEESIYTKTAFECDGLDITLEFDSNVSYSVFFYNKDAEFISSTGKLTSSYDEKTTPEKADYARIVITPNDDDKVSWYEVSKYAKQLTIEVSKVQTPYTSYSEELNKTCNAVKFVYIGHGNNTATGFSPNILSPYHWYGDVDLTEYDEMIIKLEAGYLDGTVTIEDEEKSNVMVFSAEPFGYYNSMKNLGCDIIHIEDGYVYYSVNISNLGNTRFCTTFEQVEGISVWVR